MVVVSGAHRAERLAVVTMVEMIMCSMAGIMLSTMAL
jgi:hypothetical protein